MRNNKKIAIYVLVGLIVVGGGLFMLFNRDAVQETVKEAQYRAETAVGVNRAVDRLDLDEMNTGAMQSYLDFADIDKNSRELTEREWEEAYEAMSLDSDYWDQASYNYRTRYLDEPEMFSVAQGISYFNKTEDLNPPEPHLPIAYTTTNYRYESRLSKPGIEGKVYYDMEVYGANENQACLLANANSVSFIIAYSRGTTQSTYFEKYYIRNLHAEKPDVKIVDIGTSLGGGKSERIFNAQINKSYGIFYREGEVYKAEEFSNYIEGNAKPVTERLWRNILTHIGKWDESLVKEHDYWKKLYAGVTLIPDDEDLMPSFTVDDVVARDRYFADMHHPRAHIKRIFNIKINPDLPDELFRYDDPVVTR